MAKKRSPKSKRTEVTWRSEDATRRRIDDLNQRVGTLERIMFEWATIRSQVAREDQPIKIRHAKRR